MPRAASARWPRSRRNRSSRSSRSADVPPSAALRQQHGDFGRLDRRAGARAASDDHAREPRRQRQVPDRAALVRDRAVGVERAQRLQQLDRLAPGGRRRRIEEGPAPFARARPRRRGRARGPDRSALRISGCAKAGSAPVAASSHRPIADAGLRAAGAAAPLVDGRAAPRAPFRAGSGRGRARSGARARARCRSPPARPRSSARSRRPKSPARSSECRAWPAGRRGPGRAGRARRRAARSGWPGSRMRSARSRATRSISPCPGRKTRIDPVSLSSARRIARRTGRFDPLGGIAAEIDRLDRKGAAFALDHRRVAHQPRHARAVERRRHGHEPQVLAQRPPARRAPAPGRDRRRASARGTRRTGRRRRPRARDRRGSCA